MAGSRTEKYRDIFKRCHGLLRCGALKPADKPIWYDVYRKFPPLASPSFERRAPIKKVKTILYPEDIIRAKYYQTIVNPGPIDLLQEVPRKSKSQIFVEKYFGIEAAYNKKVKTGDTVDIDLFAATLEAMQKEDQNLFSDFKHLNEAVEAKNKKSAFLQEDLSKLLTDDIELTETESDLSQPKESDLPPEDVNK